MMSLKRKLDPANPVYGMWISDGWVTSIEMAGDLGFDFVIVDMEHSPHGLDTVMQALRTLKGSGTSCVVRATGNDPLLIKRLLDVGVTNLMVPMIETADEAAGFVADCMYPPAGRRGCASAIVRASGYGLDADYLNHANDGLFLIAQIESSLGAENAAAIAGTAGVDAIFIGPTDLSGSVGSIGDFQTDAFARAVTRVEDATKAAGKALGFMPVPGFDAQTLCKRGYNIIASPSDVVLLRNAMQANLAEWKNAKG